MITGHECESWSALPSARTPEFANVVPIGTIVSSFDSTLNGVAVPPASGLSHVPADAPPGYSRNEAAAPPSLNPFRYC